MSTLSPKQLRRVLEGYGWSPPIGKLLTCTLESMRHYLCLQETFNVSPILCRSSGNKFVEKSVQYAVGAALALQEDPEDRALIRKRLAAEGERK